MSAEKPTLLQSYSKTSVSSSRLAAYWPTPSQAVVLLAYTVVT